MNQPQNPESVCPPLGAYTQSIKVTANSEWVVVAGQIGMNKKGQLASGARKQSEQAFRNLAACLKANGMRKQDLVKITVYLTDPRFIPDYRAAREKILGPDVLPTSTLLIVQGLASPEILVEVEGWAAR
jgi:2-iminobutanoate/2-iminopropanoate deaminase